MVIVQGEGEQALVRHVDGHADAVGGGAGEAEPWVVGRVPEYDDVVLADIRGRLQGGANGRGPGARPLLVGPYGYRPQAQRGRVADVQRVSSACPTRLPAWSSATSESPAIQAVGSARSASTRSASAAVGTRRG